MKAHKICLTLNNDNLSSYIESGSIVVVFLSLKCSGFVVLSCECDRVFFGSNQ